MISPIERNFGHGEICVAAASIYDREETLARELWVIENGRQNESVTRDPDFGFISETRTVPGSGELETYDVLARRTEVNGIHVTYKEKGDPDVPNRPYEITQIYGSDNGTPISVTHEMTNVFEMRQGLSTQELIRITYGTEVYEYTIGVSRNTCPRDLEQKIGSILGLKPRKSHWG